MRASSSRGQPPFHRPGKPLLIVLSGPSGVGKDAVLAMMKEYGYPIRYITTWTTRPQRPAERNGVDYHFVSVQEFQETLKNNGLMEHANVYGNWYGIPKAEVRKALERGEDVTVKVDVQGAATIKETVPQAVLIFLMPPSMEELLIRLKQRHTESPEDLALRLKTAEEEMKQLHLFDYVVINDADKIDKAVANIKAIITAEKCRVSPREISL